MGRRIRRKTKPNQMSTQKAKFELFQRLEAMGFTYEEAVQLRRIEMTLHRWSEQECGDSNSYASWAIERDEKTDKPFRCVYPHGGDPYPKPRRYPIADRERGARKRAAAIVRARNARFHGTNPEDTRAQYVQFYHQTDPRGCALYIVRVADVPEGQSLDAFYTRGLAVAA